MHAYIFVYDFGYVGRVHRTFLVIFYFENYLVCVGLIIPLGTSIIVVIQ